MNLHQPSRVGGRKLRGNGTGPCLAIVVVTLLWVTPDADAAGSVDTNSLPPPAAVTVEFGRDIQPILDRSCFRCHGPERPKSGFRLDNRESALQGGSVGVPIVVSNSAASPLIHNIARLKGVDEDLWMPPENKATPLSRDEVALFRAWIDQGASWGTAGTSSKIEVAVSPMASFTTVSGNESVFRDHYWTPEGWNGGIERFSIRQQIDARTQAISEGHISRDDYRVTLQLERQNLGFTHMGFEQYRRYYSDTGGYQPGFVPPMLTLNRDLYLNLGRAWVDMGLNLPRWPKMTVGYEYRYTDGDEAMTSWSPVVQYGITRNIAPNFQALNEKINIVKFDLDHELQGWRFEDNFRAEFYQLDTGRSYAAKSYPEDNRLVSERVTQEQDSFNWANALRVEKQFKPWLLTSAGYLYSSVDANAAFSVDQSYLAGSPGALRRWRSPDIVLARQAQVGNLNAQLGPWSGLVASCGVQGEWNQQRGLGNISYDLEQPGGTFLIQPTTASSDIESMLVAEHLGLRYTRIPFTVLFAEGRLQQESTGQSESLPGGDYPMLRETDATSDLLDVRAGFTVSPFQRVSLNASYRRFQKSANFDHQVDLLPITGTYLPGNGYPAFINSLDTDTDAVEARLAVRPAPWLNTSISYRLQNTEQSTTTDKADTLTTGARLLAGKYDANIVSFNASIKPLSRLLVSTTFSFQDARTVTAANNAPSVAPYEGSTYSVLVGSTYYWNDRTEVQLSYAFSYSDFTQSNAADTVPLGILYHQHGLQVGLRRKLNQRVDATLRYGWFYYNEPTSGTYRDYTAHMISATLTIRMP